MKLKSILYSVVLAGIIGLNACGDSESTKNVQNNNDSTPEQIPLQPIAKLELKLSTDQTSFKVGEKPLVSVVKADSLSFDSVQIYFDKKRIKTTTELPLELEVSSDKTGRINVEARVFNKENVGVQKLAIRFVSDIEPKTYSYEVVRTYPHKRDAYTQGLVFENGFFYEATGLKGQSSIRKVQVGTGEVIQSFVVDPSIFGEGVTIFGDKIIQLSWQANVGFVYDKKTFQLLAKFNYTTEGWGLTNDGKRLIMSDGTNKLYFLDPETFVELDRISVYDDKGPVNQLNELEYIDGEIYSNIYQTDKIARIDPATGKVLSYIDLKGILPESDYDADTDVLNGIAYDFDNKKLFVTGKKWPKLFEIKLK